MTISDVDAAECWNLKRDADGIDVSKNPLTSEQSGLAILNV